MRPAKAAVQERFRSRIGWLDWDETIPEVVEVPFEDGLTCETASCLLVGCQLLLVPPEGTPPLVDRVPRGADS